MKKTKWYAIAQDRLARLGPFETQLVASKAVMDENQHPLPGCFVWPEEIPVTQFDNGNSTSDTLPCNVVPRARSYKVQAI
jgi:hypothetical protein